jgi:hypothetical protein
LATAVKAADSIHIMTSELSFNLSTSFDDTTNGNNWPGLLSLNGVDTYYPAYDETLHARSQSTTAPPIMIETGYDGEGAGAGGNCDNSTNLRHRRQEWWSFTTGANGYI